MPLGRGHLLAGNAIVNRVIGGWNVSSITRIQSGRPFKLTSGRSTFNQADSGVVLNGITSNQLQDLITVRDGPNKNKSFVDGSLVGPDGRANTTILCRPRRRVSSASSYTFPVPDTSRRTWRSKSKSPFASQ